jgi:cardiolipin synthase
MLIAAFSRAGYRPLLKSGVRIFEWNGSMLHAKTAVADGSWARVGSSNLNPSSFISNYEIDVAMEHVGLAREMEEMFLADLENATEIVIDLKHRVVPDGNAPLRGDRGKPARRGASGRAIGAIRFAHAVVDTVVGRRRSPGFAKSRLMAICAGGLLASAAIAVLWPRAIALPLAVVMGWAGAALMVRAIRLWRRRARQQRQAERNATVPAPAPVKTVEAALVKSTKIIVPRNTELVNIIGEMAGILPQPSRSTTPEKSCPMAPVRGGNAEPPFKGKGG